LLFLDGDVLLSPDAVLRHGRLGDDELGRGEQRHLRARASSRSTYGNSLPGREARVRSIGDVAQYLVTEEMVANEPYEKLLARSEAAIYPGGAARKLYELEMGALRGRSAPHAEWMAAAGHNFSFRARLFWLPEASIKTSRSMSIANCGAGPRVAVEAPSTQLVRAPDERMQPRSPSILQSGTTPESSS